MGSAATTGSTGTVSDQANTTAVWLRALNFEERITRIAGSLLVPSKASDRESYAREKCAWWQDQLRHGPEEIIEWRTREFAVAREQVLDIIGISGEELEALPGPLPAWYEDLQEILQQKAPLERIAESIGNDSMLSLCWPWLQWARGKFEQTISHLNFPPDLKLQAQTATVLLLPALRKTLHEVVERTFILELNVAREMGELEGESSQRRYASFVRRLCDPSHGLPLWKEYPVLCRILTVEARRWIETSMEFIGRLLQDWEEIKKTLFAGKAPGSVRQIRIGAGDRHRGGRTVNILEFEDQVLLVYKPRSMQKDLLFHEVLSYLQDYGNMLDMYAVKILGRSDYAWSEFVPHKVCSQKHEFARFYRRAGHLLAVIFNLYGTDVHYENLIACGEYPVIIDLECLLAQPYGYYGVTNQSVLAHAWTDTLFSTHLIPSHIVGGADGLELSGFSEANQGRLTPFPVMQCEGANSDEAKIVFKRVLFSEGLRFNSPAGEPNTNSPRQYVDFIIRGFQEAIEALIEGGDSLLSTHLWQDLCEQPGRYVPWRTMNYERLMMDSYHPNLLRDAMDREAFLDRLWTRSGNREIHSAFLPAERKALWEQDIPAFFAHPKTSNLVDCRGLKVEISGSTPVAIKAEKRVRSLDKSFIARQSWTIDVAFSSSSESSIRRQLDANAWKPNLEPRDKRSEMYRSVAEQIANRILSLSFPEDDQLFWVDTRDASTRNIRRHYASVIPAEFYAGLSGFLMFFQRAGQVLGNPEYARAALSCARTLTALFKDQAKLLSGVLGGFSGITSSLYAFTHLLSAQPCPELEAACENMLDLIEHAIDADDKYDIMAGSAGTICLLLGYYRALRNAHCLALAERCGQLLVKSGQPQTRGIAWKTAENSMPLGGFAHGTSGIAHSLFLLAKATGKEEYLKVALAAIEYDRSTYSPEHQNWLDLRDGFDSKDTVAWCYGAPGVGLARMAQIMLGFGDQQCYEEVELAVGKTLGTQWRAHNLCHGAFGNLEFLLLAADRLKRADWRQRAAEFLDSILEEVQDFGFLFDGNAETLNLMLGLSGIADVFLRAGNPQEMPTFLLLEPPLEVRGWS